jgi:hypothetical protein
MASTISAGTTAGTALNMTGDTTGNLAFQTGAGAYTQTMPNATGTVMVSGNMPAFGYYQSVASSLTGSNYTKVTFTTSEFDTTGGMYASSRFTPTIAGYYQINAGMQTSGSAISAVLIYKNGTAYRLGAYTGGALSSGEYNIGSVVYCNGSTDYIEIYGYNGSTTQNTTAGLVSTYFNGCMIRSA